MTAGYWGLGAIGGLAAIGLGAIVSLGGEQIWGIFSGGFWGGNCGGGLVACGGAGGAGGCLLGRQICGSLSGTTSKFQ